MKHVLWLLVLVSACGGKDPAPAQPHNEAAGSAAPAATSPPPADDPAAARARAELEARQAALAANEAMERVRTIELDLDAFNAKVNAAVDAVVNAQNDADRAAAKARLDGLRTEKLDLEQRVAAAKAAAAKAERAQGVRVSPECMDNPLAKGCS
jgi:hypothetical protein